MGFFGGGGGGSSAPGGVAGDTQVIFNDAGTLAGDGSLLYDKVGDRLLVGGPGPFTAGAILEVKSITGTLLLPRVTTTQRNAIGAPNGSILFNTDTGRLSLVAGSAWGELLNTNSGGDVDFTSGSFYFHAPVGGGFRGVNWISDAAGGGYAYLMSANSVGTTFLRTSVTGVAGFTPGLTEMLTQNYGGTQATRVLLYSGGSFSYAAIYATAGYWSGLVLGSSNQPDTTTALQLDSNYGALLLPRLTTVQRGNVALVNGKLIFNTDNQQIHLVAGGTWHGINMDMLNRSSARLVLATAYSAPNTLWRPITFDTVLFDTANMRANAGGFNGAISAPVTGSYFCTLTFVYPPTTAGPQIGYYGISKNAAFDTPVASGSIPANTATATPVTLNAVIALNAGDYLHSVIGNFNGSCIIAIGATFSISLIG